MIYFQFGSDLTFREEQWTVVLKNIYNEEKYFCLKIINFRSYIPAHYKFFYACTMYFGGYS